MIHLPPQRPRNRKEDALGGRIDGGPLVDRGRVFPADSPDLPDSTLRRLEMKLTDVVLKELVRPFFWPGQQKDAWPTW